VRFTKANTRAVYAYDAGRTGADHFNAGSGNKTDIGEALRGHWVCVDADDHAHVPATQVSHAVVYRLFVDVVQR